MKFVKILHMKQVYIFCKKTTEKNMYSLLHTVATRTFLKKNIEWNVKQLKRNVPRFKKVKEVVLSSICILEQKN